MFKIVTWGEVSKGLAELKASTLMMKKTAQTDGPADDLTEMMPQRCKVGPMDKLKNTGHLYYPGYYFLWTNLQDVLHTTTIKYSKKSLLPKREQI